MSVNRITGITSGIDTDSMIKDLMKIEQMKIDDVEKNKTYTEWEQEEYREVINSIRAFKDGYFDVLNPESNFRSATAFSQFSESVQVDGTDVSYLTAKGTSSIVSYSHEIASIDQLATYDEWNTDALNLSRLEGDAVDFGSLPSSLQFYITIDSETKSIDIPSTAAITDQASLVSAINSEIVAEYGSDYDGVVQASATPDAIYFEKSGSKITALAATGKTDELEWLGFNSGDTNKEYLDKTIEELFSVTSGDLSSMTINGESMTDLGLDETSTLRDLTNTISNNGDINVDLSYNSTTDSFYLRSDSTGTASDITMSATFMSKFGFTDVDDGTHHISSQNAKLNLDGVDIVKSNNNFTIDGIQYELKETYSDVDPIKIEVDKNIEGIKEKIEEFVTTYNGLISSINSKLIEERDRDFEPLTSAEKEALSDDEVEQWETKAKSGILRGNQNLSDMLTEMRQALYESVEGVGITLADLGIQTSTNYKDKGKLVIDDADLTEALNNNYEEIVDLFTNKSDYEYLDRENSSERYSENGLSNRLFDIIEDNIRTTRDENGYKGTLLVKAGVVGDVTEFENLLTDMLDDYDQRIVDLYANFYDKEDSYYLMFANMESALSEMQAQGNSLLSQLG